MTNLSDLITVPTHSTTLPVLKKKVEFRPFLVKEQRVLLQVQEENDPKAAVEAVLRLIDACTFHKLDIESLSATDVEFLLIQIRINSVGDSINLRYRCAHCSHENDITVKLSSIVINTPPAVDNPIELQPNLWIQMRPPSVIDSILAEQVDQFAVVARCITSIIVGEEIYETKDQPFEQVLAFVDKLQSHQQAKIRDFLESYPTIHLPIEFACNQCGKQNKTTAQGLADFFG